MKKHHNCTVRFPEKIKSESIVYQGEREYVVNLIRNAIKICEFNIVNVIKGEELIENSNYLKDIYDELSIIVDNPKWYWNFIFIKDRELNESIMSLQRKAIKTINQNIKNAINYKKYILNKMERAFIFMDLDLLKVRSENNTQIDTNMWYNIYSGFKQLLINIESGISERAIKNVIVKINYLGEVTGYKFIYGGLISNINLYTCEELCEKYIFYRRWMGELYNEKGKCIYAVDDFTQILRSFRDAHINKLVNKSATNMNNEKLGNEYVEMLEKGISYKRNGQYELAKKMYIEAIKYDNEMPTAYYNLGKILYILRDFDASARAYKAAYERNMCDFIRSSPFGVYNFYVNLGHSILDGNMNMDKYDNIIKTYREGLSSGKLVRYGLSDGIMGQYEELCVKEAQRYLGENMDED